MFDPLREDNNPVLRQNLDTITTDYIGDRVGEQLQLMAAVGREHPHAISLISEARPSQPEKSRFTCFQYTFELTDPPPEIVRIATLYGHVYPSAEFVQFLIDNYLTEIRAGEVHDGDVVLYLANGRIKHAGKADGGFVVSKWGTAHLWKHRLFEVPLAYGSQVRFFRPIAREDSVSAFIDYAEDRLGKDPVAACLR